MNALERAVIEAARAWRAAREIVPGERAIGLVNALAALDEHEKATAADGVSEVPWQLVAVDDELRARSGTFYPVTATKREWNMGRPTGNFLITVQLPTGPKMLTRPTPAEPMATVRRGAAGRAVDQFVHVMSSGEDDGFGRTAATRGDDGA